MVTVRVQHAFNAKNGLAADAVINTFHFTTINPDAVWLPAQADALRDNVLDFYDANPPGLNLAVRSFLAEDSFANPRHTFRMYDMADPEPRIPRYLATHPGLGTAAASTSLPHEVAVCLSYRAESVSGQIPARRRGRIYIGPLNTTVLFEDAQGHSRPHQDFQNILTAAAKHLQEDAQADGWNWVVRSGGGPSDGELGGGDLPSVAELTTAGVDNAFDTQRRRGPKATGRTTVAI